MLGPSVLTVTGPPDPKESEEEEDMVDSWTPKFGADKEW
jgi:hypothetical protein